MNDHEIPSLTELHDNSYALIQAALVEGRDPADLPPQPELQVENNRVFSFVTAAAARGCYQWFRDHLAHQAIPTQATGWWLRQWLRAYSLKWKEATPAQGALRITGAPGAILPVDAQWRIDQALYAAAADATIDPSGEAVVAVTALVAGPDGNQPAATELTLVSPYPGIDPTGVVTGDGLTRGLAAETEAVALARLKHRLSYPLLGGAPHDYERWALSVPGITRAWGLWTPADAGSAGVIVMADANEPDGLPTAADLQAVYDYIRDPRRGPPDDLFVIAPAPQYLDAEIHLDPDTAAVRQAVELELRDLFFRSSSPGVTIPHTHLVEAASVAAGEYTHQFLVPAIQPGGAIVSGPYELPILRGVTFS